MSDLKKTYKPFVSPETNMKELTVKSILVGSLFGVIFGASTVYLALKAGLTVSASIPIAVIAITLGRRFLKTTILENNIYIFRVVVFGDSARKMLSEIFNFGTFSLFLLFCRDVQIPGNDTVSENHFFLLSHRASFAGRLPNSFCRLSYICFGA